MSILFAIPNTETSSRLQWFLSDSPGEADPVAETDLSVIKASRTVLVASGRDVFSGRIETVARSEKQLRQIALFQLEDELAEPLSNLHAAIRTKAGGAESERRVDVVSHAAISNWINALETSLGKSADNVQIIADTSLLLETGQASLFEGFETVLISNGINAYALDVGLADQMVPALLQSWDLTGYHLYSENQGLLSPDIASRAADVTSVTYPDFVADLLWNYEGLNLRQGTYRAAEKVDLGFAQKWVGTLVLAAICACLWLGYMALTVNRLEAETDRLYQQSVTAYRQIFPDEGNVANPLARVTEKLRNTSAVSAEVPLTTLLSAYYTALSKVEGVELVSVSFSGTTGRLTSSLKFSSYQDRDKLKQVMDAAGLNIQLGGVAQEEGFLVGQAVIGGAS